MRGMAARGAGGKFVKTTAPKTAKVKPATFQLSELKFNGKPLKKSK